MWYFQHANGWIIQNSMFEALIYVYNLFSTVGFVHYWGMGGQVVSKASRWIWNYYAIPLS